MIRIFGLLMFSIGILTLVTAQDKVSAKDPAELKAIETLRNMGAQVLEVNDIQKYTAISYPKNLQTFTADYLAPIKALNGDIHLNLSNQPINDGHLAQIASMDKITHLNLEKTKVTDNGIANLKGLKNIERMSYNPIKASYNDKKNHVL